MVVDVLVLEDEPLIALELKSSLEECSPCSVSTFARGDQAQKWLDEHTPALAIADVTLSDGDCEAVVQTLNDRGVAVFVHTGHEPRLNGLEPSFRGKPTYVKPVDTLGLVEDTVRLIKDIAALVPGHHCQPQS